MPINTVMVPPASRFIGLLLLGASVILHAAPATTPPAAATGLETAADASGDFGNSHRHHIFSPYASIAPVGYVPAQIRRAYTLDQITNLGTGQTIAIVVAYGSPTVQNDLDVFSRQFGLPLTTIQTVYGSRKSSIVDAGWALETALDVQWAHAIAPKAKIILAVAASPSVANLISAVDAAKKAGAKVISMSWGAPEFTSEVNYDSHFKAAGVTFVAASGDNGAGAIWPAASPNVMSVGGTRLSLDASGLLLSPETGWSGSGGGFSGVFAKPTYQTNWQSSAYRAIPDVALVADPATGVTVYNSTPYGTQTGWFQVGGTSASCPMWAAMIALANEQRVAVGKSTLTGGQAAVYTAAGSNDSAGVPAYGFYFFDVTIGSNGAYSSTPLFDEVTGLGTPAANNLVTKLKGL